MKSLLRNAAVACAAGLVGLLLGEGLLRVTTDATFLARPFTIIPWMAFDPVAGWVNRSGFQSHSQATFASVSDDGLRINALGFHGPELVEPKPPGGVRIICLGDSGTFGIWWELRPKDDKPVLTGFVNYPQELAQLLRSRLSEVEVINAGVIGYSSSHSLRQFETQLRDFDPDIVTVRFGYNDHGRAWKPAARADEPRSRIARWLLYRLHRWRILQLGLAGYQQVPAFHPQPNSVFWAPAERFERNLRRFAEIARHRGFRLLFMDYPLRPAEWGESPTDARIFRLSGAADGAELRSLHAQFQGVLRDVAQSEGVPLLESRAAFHVRMAERFTRGDLVHPNAAGARKLAQLLRDRLVELTWLPAPLPATGAAS